MNYAVFEPSPNEAVSWLKELIKDKIVYDIGAGDGRFALAMTEYAKRVVAVEINEMYAGDCRLRKLDTINSNFLNMSFKEAEVIYIFMGMMGNYALTQKLKEDDWHGTVISHFYPLMNTMADIIPPDSVIHAKAENSRSPFLIYYL